MVIPRARSSGALSMLSKDRNFASPFIASTLVIAAVSVVLPWSTCPIVPTFTCGLVLSNFPLAITISCSLSFLPDRLLAGHLGADYGLRDALRRLGVVLEFHRVRRPPLGQRA